MKKLMTKLALSAGGLVAAMPVGQVFAQIEVSDINPGTGFASDIGVLMNSVLTFVMVVAALLVFLYLIMGGIEWITSGGDKGKTESARNKITAAVIGLVILAASYAVLLLALNFLGFGSLNDVFNNINTLEGGG